MPKRERIEKNQGTQPHQNDRPHREVRVRDERTREAPDGLGQINVGDRVRAKITHRTGEVTDVAYDGRQEQVTVSYDDAPQDQYLTTPARDGAQLPRALVDPA